jgi:hypothetical protein
MGVHGHSPFLKLNNGMDTTGGRRSHHRWQRCTDERFPCQYVRHHGERNKAKTSIMMTLQLIDVIMLLQDTRHGIKTEMEDYGYRNTTIL